MCGCQLGSYLILIEVNIDLKTVYEPWLDM